MSWDGHVVRIGDLKGAYRALVGRPEGNKLFGRPRCRWGENIKMNLQDVGWVGMSRVDLTRDKDRWRALVKAVMNSGSKKLGNFLSR